MNQDENKLQLENFEDECGIANWALLKAHFKRGAMVWVSNSLDIIKVGRAVVNDDKYKIEAWMQAKLITPFPIALAETEPSMRCVIAQPWVLAQEI